MYLLAVLRPVLDAMPALADSGYEGAGHDVHVPVKKPAGMKELDISNRTRNALLSSARCLGERGFALLAQRWQILQTVTASPGEIGLIAARRVRGVQVPQVILGARLRTRRTGHAGATSPRDGWCSGAVRTRPRRPAGA